MAKYNVLVKSNNGAERTVELQAPSESILRKTLEQKKVEVLRVEEIKKVGLFESMGIDIYDKPMEVADIKTFTTQFSVLISSGISLLKALTILKQDCKHPRLKKVLNNSTERIVQGASFHETLMPFSKDFGTTYIAMIKAGEMSGKLDKVLLQLAIYIEKKEKTAKLVKKAMMYPIMALSFALTICTLLLIFVVPRFVTIFESQGMELPGPTQFVLNLSNFIVDKWYFIIAGLVALVLFFIAMRSGEATRMILERAYIKIPIFGNLIRKGIVERLSRVWSLLLEANLELLESFEVIQEVVEYHIYKEAFRNAAHKLSQGSAVSIELSRYPDLFPELLRQLVQVGEETGKMEYVLGKVAEYYEGEVEAEIGGIISLIEPAMIIILGSLVGGLVVALYMPVFSMASGV